MSHFYGVLRNSVNQNKTLRGFKTHGFDGTLASWNGAIGIRIYQNSDGQDCFRVYQTSWHGQGINEEIASGVIGEKVNSRTLGTQCPSCESYELISVDHIETDSGSAWQKINCNSCKATWKDIYKLTGYDNLEKGY